MGEVARALHDIEKALMEDLISILIDEIPEILLDGRGRSSPP